MAKKLLKLTTLLSVLLLMLMLTGCPPKVVYYQLTVTTEGNGHVDKDPEPEEKGYLKGTTVELTAVADEGWEFEKWVIGEDENTNNPYTITMDSDKSVEAVFKAEEPPVDQFTLTVAKAGVGDGSVTPAVGPHEYDEGEVVTLTAEADENSVFVKWVVDDVEFEDATVIATMTKDILATAHFDLKPDVLPEIILEWTSGDLMVLGAPCTAPEDGLGFQYLVGDSDSSLTEASWSIVKGEEVVYGPIAIPSSRFYNSWTGSITAAMLGADPVGGIYSLTMTATKTGGISKTEKIDFYVHTDEAAIDGVDFAGEIVLFEGTAILTGDEATLEATITLDSKVRVRIYAYEGEWDCECVDNALLYDGFLTREASSTEKETFELDLTKLKSGVNYDKLRIIVYNEICGTMPCNYCPDDEKDIDLVFDKTVTLDCEPCTCAPCTPCWNGEFNPGVRIMNLLFKDSDFFDVSATINGETIPATLIEAPVEDGDDLVIRAIIREEDFPELAGDALLIWTVTTVTGQSVVVECDEDFDFIPPEVDILLECDCDATTTVVPILFTDEAGLKEANVWFGESVSGLIKKVTFDATPTGESTTTFTSGFTSGWEFPATGMIYDVIATIELDPAKIVSPTLGGSYTVYADAEDTSCNISDVAMETCAIDFVAPTITYFGLDCVGTDCDLCEATQTTLVWHIRDVNFDYAEISVNYGNLCSDGQCGNTFITESTDGTVLWEFPFADCREITATIKAVDDCENESSKTIKFDVDNVPPELDLEWCVEPETCDATFARFSWTMDDPCTPTVYFERSIPIGRLDYVVMGNGEEHTIEYTSDGTTTQSGIIQWSWDEEEFDCTELTILATAVDYRCENRTEASLTTDVEIDKLLPGAFLDVSSAAAIGVSGIYGKDTVPSCDATCVWVNWVVFENCLESIEIWSNYPSVCETGGTGEYLEDEYLLFSYPGMSVNTESGWYYATTSATYTNDNEVEDEVYQPVKAYWGSIKVCLPSNLDCEDFVATITAVQTCKPDIDDSVTYTSDDDDSALIDRKAPELEFGWEDGITPTQCATEATLTVSITDGSFPCAENCQIGLLEWEFRPVGGTIDTVHKLLVSEDDLAFDGDTYSGSLHVKAPQNQECGTYVATFTAYDCCCSVDHANKKVSEPVSVYVDTLYPTIEHFYLSDKNGNNVEEDWVGCGATNTYLFWDATDTCFDEIEIEVSDGELVWESWLTTDATGVVEWRFGEVSGETLIATLTAYDLCNETVAGPLSAYVRNTGPVLWSGTSFRFDAQSDTIVLRFNEEVETESATAVLYFRTNPDDDWLAMTTYGGVNSGNGGIYSGSTGDDYVVVEVAKFVAKNIVGDPEIVLGTQYKLELFDIYASDTQCSGENFYTEPNPIVVEGQGTALSPEL